MATAMQMPTMGPSAGHLRSPAAPAAPCAIQSQQPPANHSTPGGIFSSGGLGMSNLTLGLPPGGGGGGGAAAAAGVLVGVSSANSFGASIAIDQTGLLRVKLADILPEEGEPSPVYLRAVDAVSTSLARANAVIIELNSEDAKLVRCALQSAKLYLKNCVHTTTTTHAWGSSDWNKSTACRDSFVYKAGRSEEADPPPPCMPDVFRCMGKASRASLSAIARYLRLRGDVFHTLLDDWPLQPGDVSSSDLTANLHHTSAAAAAAACGKGLLLPGDTVQEVEKGLLMLVASDTPGLLVSDSNGNWYTADSSLSPGDLLLLAGRALHQATAGLRRPSPYRIGMPSPIPGAMRTFLAFRLMPHHAATFDIAAALKTAGHPVPEGFGPITVAQFMDGLSAAETLMGNSGDSSLDAHEDSALKLALCDPLSGAFLEDAMLNPKCGHSFGCITLQRARESGSCPTCSAQFDAQHLIPNIALRAAASAYKREELNRIQSRAKRRRENGDSDVRRRENIGSPTERDGVRVTKGVQYPFKVNERVMIKGNKRTPEKFVGREAIITSQCLNGWYLVRTLDTNESVRLQYRSLQASGDNATNTNNINNTNNTTTNNNNNSSSNALNEEQVQASHS